MASEKVVLSDSEIKTYQNIANREKRNVYVYEFEGEKRLAILRFGSLLLQGAPALSHIEDHPQASEKV